MYVLLISVLMLFQSTSGLVCEHYTEAANTQETHGCNDTQIDENGVCNITVKCEERFPSGHIHCYASWKNVSGKITLTKSGCWIKSDECMQKSRCQYSGKENEVYFCCCDSDLCNSQYYLNITTDPVLATPPDKRDDEEEHVVIYVVVSLLLVIALILSFIFCYRKRRKDVRDLDAASMVTPASGQTNNTVDTHLLPPSKPELNLPQLVEMKARGRFGCVWKAQLQDRFVAVKSFDLQDKQSWQNEQDIFNTTLINTHQNILRFITAASRGVGVEIEFWLITEFHEHGSLTDYLKTTVVSITDALRIIEGMATGLAFLHEDIMCGTKSGPGGYKPAIAHRDFKSKNVLITNQKTAVIADFGLAIKFIPGESPGETHGQVGTRRYMAPEILEGAINFQRDAFLRIDMYAFALVAWEVISRCFDAPGGAAPTYLMPYEEELGQHPPIEVMQENVVEKKLRPRILHEWRQHEITGLVCETIEECWDHDVEARLSAGCVEERIRNLQKKIIAPPTDISIQSNCLNCAPTHVELQNQINCQKNEINFSEQSHLINTEENTLEASDQGYVTLPSESVLHNGYNDTLV